MIRVAICDDDKMEIENAVSFLDNYAKTHQDNKFTVVTFEDGNALLRHIHKNAGFEIYLLDVMLKKGQLGTDLARAIIEKGQGGQIIFLTSSVDYAVDAFSINATHYLIKPYTRAAFEEAMNRAIANIVTEEPESIVKNTNQGIAKIVLNNILYSESNGHYQHIHMRDGNMFKIRSKTQELWADLSKYKQFFRPHCGYIVNRDHVKSINTNSITVGQDLIPLSKNSYTKVKKEYLDYIFNKQEGM